MFGVFLFETVVENREQIIKFTFIPADVLELYLFNAVVLESGVFRQQFLEFVLFPFVNLLGVTGQTVQLVQLQPHLLSTFLLLFLLLLFVFQ